MTVEEHTAISMAPGNPLREHAPEATAQSPIAQSVRAEGAFVMRLARRLGTPAEDVDDVAQEVFLTLHRRYQDLSPETALRSFLFGIVRRTVANHRRKLRGQRTLSVAHANQPADDAPGPQEVLEQRDDRAILDAALAELRDEQREVFVLFELEGMAMQEVSELTECALKTAYSRLYAAREIVKRSVLRARATGKVR